MTERVDLRWMKLGKYSEMTGHTPDAVQKLRKRGFWRDGYHCKIIEGNLWVSYTRAQEWADQWDAESRMAPPPQADEASSHGRMRRAARPSSSISAISG